MSTEVVVGGEERQITISHDLFQPARGGGRRTRKRNPDANASDTATGAPIIVKTQWNRRKLLKEMRAAAQSGTHVPQLTDDALENATTSSGEFIRHTQDYLGTPIHTDPFPGSNAAIHITQKPIMGCLKGGKLPTRTQQQSSPVQIFIGGNTAATATATAPTTTTTISPGQPLPPITNPVMQNSASPSFTQHAAGAAPIFATRFNESLPETNVRKTLKKTYRVGRSADGQISVLLPDVKRRREIAAHRENLTRKSMTDIKKYLIKKGYIRGATAAPQNMLQTMYENLGMINGVVTNHNAEIMLDNYIKGFL
jgi:hypothetical protein